MSAIHKISKAFIEIALKEAGLKYFIDSDGDFMMQFEKGDHGHSLIMYVIISGDNKDVLQVQIFADDFKVPQRKWPKLLVACNEWNKTRRWPKMYLNYKEGDETAKLIAEGSIDCESGIHKELMLDFIRTHLGGASQFWKWAIDNDRL